jgi:hypothetical protein
MVAWESYSCSLESERLVLSPFNVGSGSLKFFLIRTREHASEAMRHLWLLLSLSREIDIIHSIRWLTDRLLVCDEGTSDRGDDVAVEVFNNGRI